MNPLPLYGEALKNTMPNLMVGNAMRIENNRLVTESCELEIESRVNVLAYGKASVKMYQAAKELLGEKLFGHGLLITHQKGVEIEVDASRESVLYSSHPFMTLVSCEAGAQAKAFVESHDEKDILLALVSGGGSAMVALPAGEVVLEEKIEFISNVMHMAVPEREVNVLKKALSAIKGGKLAEAAKDKCIVNFILSDERNHQLSAISSGMTVCNEEIDPIQVMDHYRLWGLAPEGIANVLRAHGRRTGIGCDKVIYNHVIGSRDDLIESIKATSSEHGFEAVHLIENMHSCTPEEAVEILSGEYSRLYETVTPGRHLVISTGEVQVKVENREEVKGGRNQHITALFMAKNAFPAEFCFVAVATDGMDYLEGVHGAYFDSSMREEVERQREFIEREIRKSNTHSVHQKLGSLLEGERTGTNMSDFFLFAFDKR